MRCPSGACPDCRGASCNIVGAVARVSAKAAPAHPRARPKSKTISDRTTSDFIEIPRLRPSRRMCCRYGRCFRGRGFFVGQRSCRALQEHLQTWKRILLCSFLSLFHFPEKEAKVPFGPDLRPVRSWDNYSHFRSLVLLWCWFPRL